MAIKKSELYSSIWASCDELRGGMDASQYKDYVLVLLFVKYVSDKYSGQKNPLIVIPKGGSFKDMVAAKGDKDIGNKMNIIIAALAKENGLKGVIDLTDFNDPDKLGKGKEMVDRLSKLVAIFENPALDFTRNRAEGDDLLGDAYEYLMRHFATESGKSKGQFYTPAEVSRIMAKVIGISQADSANTTIYDPTCGSGSLLLKAADEAKVKISIYGQEMDNSTAGLARMNMILHDNPSAEIWKDNTLSEPHYKEKNGQLKQFDYAVANPPFSTSAWKSGFDAEHDPFDRFEDGMPPEKNGDYAFLQHLLMCSLIHKFAGKEEGDVSAYIEELQKNLPKDFKAKGDIYVFVDECHRTQSGDLHKAMKAILPSAMFIGFTGTPLLKSDKQKSIEVFGTYIHTYKYDQAVRDGVVLDLRYEARDIDQNITSQEKIDQWFEAKTRGLNDIARAQLKQRWGTMQAVLSSQDRLEKIVADILFDMETRDRLQSGHGNALLVSGSIYQACKFYELFIANGFTKCAIITSYRPSVASIKGEETGEGQTEHLHQYEIYNKMLNSKDVETFEKEVKKKFIDEPGQMKLLIVVDKLLTGFDAPPATYLYIDKKMQDHSLFQAICRVNRLDSDDKEYGYVIDYKDLFQSLEGSIHDYTSGAFDAYDKEDVTGLLTDRLDKARERLEEAREAIKALCEAVPTPRDTLAYQHYFCAYDTSNKDALKDNEPKRIALYKLTASLIRAYANIANEMDEADYTAAEVEKIKGEVDHFEKARMEIKLASGDYIDLKMYEPAMRHLIDTYIRAEESRKVSAFDDLTLIQLIVERGEDAFKEMPAGIAADPAAMAETIENNLRRVIIDEQPINPKYYEKMSELLDTLIQERKAQAHSYEEYLKRYVDLSKQVTNPSGGITYPKSLNNSARRALYDNLGKNEELAIALDRDIRATKKDDWRGHTIKEREVLYAIRKYVTDEAEAERVFELVKNQPDY